MWNAASASASCTWAPQSSSGLESVTFATQYITAFTEPRHALPPQLPAVAFVFGNWQRSSPAPPRSVSRTAHAWPVLSLSSAHSGREEIFPHHQVLDTSAPPDLPALASNP